MQKLGKAMSKLWMAKENIREASKEAIDDYVAMLKPTKTNIEMESSKQIDMTETRDMTNAT
jgi:hypothetical protein